MGERLAILRLHWDHLRYLARTVRGISKDRTDKRYWRCVEHPSHFPGTSHDYFVIFFIAWPGLSYVSQTAGKIVLGGAEEAPTSWFIYDVQVLPRFRQRGLGTAIVRAGIAFARRHDARELRGTIMIDDHKHHPFLPAWYTQLGFTVAPNFTFKMTFTHNV